MVHIRFDDEENTLCGGMPQGNETIMPVSRKDLIGASQQYAKRSTFRGGYEVPCSDCLRVWNE
jgi:hypothetical protein